MSNRRLTTEDRLRNLIEVNSPIIYIEDWDYVFIDELILQVINDASKITEFNLATGNSHFLGKFPNSEYWQPGDLVSFLEGEYKLKNAGEKYIVLKGIHSELENNPTVVELIHLIAQRKLFDETFDTTLIIISPVRYIPTEIVQYVSFLDVDYPTEEEISEIIDHHVEVNHAKYDKQDKQKIIQSLKGLRKFEVDRMIDMALVSNGSLGGEDTEMILQQKKAMVKQSGVLELIDTKPVEAKNDDERRKILDEQIGGLNKLKDYISAKAKVMNNWTHTSSMQYAAQDFGVAMPKGAFIVGMPGCGTSLCAQVSASIFNAPLLKMDMGSLMGKYVGESEANLRKAIRISEAASPCILWIDEIEKAFAGVGGQNSEVLTRMFGYFLGWLQDKKSPVYVIATANNANNLPPELKRKGRFDELFCVELPNDKERESIYMVHLKPHLRKGHKCMDGIAENDLEKWAKELAKNESKKVNGADIKSIVDEAIEQCYLNGESLSLEVLRNVLGKTISIGDSCRDQIADMRKAFKTSSFIDAYSGKATELMDETEKDQNDMSKQLLKVLKDLNDNVDKLKR